MKKRTFLKSGLILTVGAAASPLLHACSPTNKVKATAAAASAGGGTGPHKLPELPYGYKALEPHIDTLTMQIHHGKHHNGYVNKLNKAVSGTKMESFSIQDLMSVVTPDNAGVRNSGGGHFNHSLYWKVMTPGGSPATGSIANAIDKAFGSMDKFSAEFTAAAKGRFGSGWAWLCVDTQKNLFISSTPNQDNPLMKNIVEKTGTPILGIDVWEHAYYLKNQNRRGDYIDSFLKVINWKQVGENYAAAMDSK